MGWIVASGGATGVGALMACAIRQPTDAAWAVLLGIASGVMLAAASVGLLAPSLALGRPGETLAGLALGVLLMVALTAALSQRARERGAPLIAALTIHNVPEGLAVGLAFAAGGMETGVPLAIAIGIQNVPEGLVAAAPLLPAGVRTRTAVGVGFMTGMVEPPAALLALAASSHVAAGLPLGLGLAAGAMFIVTLRDLLPASLRRSAAAGGMATAAGLCGFLLLERGLA